MKSKNPINVCRICFKDLSREVNLLDLLNETTLCYSCFLKFKIYFKKEKINEVEVLTIYQYNNFLRGLIYQYKGAYDYELKTIFLNYYKEELKIKYRNYVIVPMPSNEEEDEKRGFNHVVEIFRELDLPILSLFYKKEKWKQSDKNFSERQNIKNVLGLKKNLKLPENILLVDDIFTTGATISAAINLLKRSQLKRLKVLILARNVE